MWVSGIKQATVLIATKQSLWCVSAKYKPLPKRMLLCVNGWMDGF